MSWFSWFSRPKHVPATAAKFGELSEAAEQAASRLKNRPSGWPRRRTWPLLVKRVRYGAAIDERATYLRTQSFVWVRCFGLWLGEDGSLYWRTGLFSCRFYRPPLEVLAQVYDSVRVAWAIEHLNELDP